MAWSGWLAAAAALVLAVLAWWPAATTAPGTSDRADVQARLAAAPDRLSLRWTATEDPTAGQASGEVVWSDSLQAGYMVFRALEANDPAEQQYQLWVFDAERDDRYPVDGGVFDVPAGVEEVVVPIDTKLPVEQATLFAVTVERPGGVVVSSRERIALLAQVGAD